ncbi:MAG: ATP-binding protein, partial [Lachnospiraceae bacterium]|nr:ATP-binding protein [Lachnospiraceae bacterium]
MKRLERQMSARRQFLAVREWEMESLKELSGRLCEARSDSSDLKFFFSFTMPKLGKEFDLLRVNEASVINIELKSGEVSDEAILRQLIQNKYYLAALGKSMYFYTFVS